jgi:hypothetical protein
MVRTDDRSEKPPGRGRTTWNSVWKGGRYGGICAIVVLTSSSIEIPDDEPEVDEMWEIVFVFERLMAGAPSLENP